LEGKTVSARKRIEVRQGAAETFAPVALAHGNCDPASECSEEELARTRAVRKRLEGISQMPQQNDATTKVEHAEKIRCISLVAHVGIPVKVNTDSGGKPNGVPERR
jgi:hypothetical protein